VVFFGRARAVEAGAPPSGRRRRKYRCRAAYGDAAAVEGPRGGSAHQRARAAQPAPVAAALDPVPIGVFADGRTTPTRRTRPDRRARAAGAVVRRRIARLPVCRRRHRRRFGMKPALRPRTCWSATPAKKLGRGGEMARRAQARSSRAQHGPRPSLKARLGSDREGPHPGLRVRRSGARPVGSSAIIRSRWVESTTTV